MSERPPKAPRPAGKLQDAFGNALPASLGVLSTTAKVAARKSNEIGQSAPGPTGETGTCFEISTSSDGGVVQRPAGIPIASRKHQEVVEDVSPAPLAILAATASIATVTDSKAESTQNENQNHNIDLQSIYEHQRDSKQNLPY